MRLEAWTRERGDCEEIQRQEWVTGVRRYHLGNMVDGRGVM